MKLLIPEYKIERRVRALAHRISEDHKTSGNPHPPVMVCVLNGAFMFFTDLIKDMGIDVEIDFIRAKSYASNGLTHASGVEITKDIEVDVTGKRLYIVDDMIDTGATMVEVISRLEDRAPADIQIVTLVDRKDSRDDLPNKHTAFPNMGDDWFVGYGFDDNGLKRNYRNIYSANVVDSK
ncbi:phosphoribosyltransferase family protein [bacterium]|nr:phosphoribosyltransferase family protein [bacterium]